METLSMDFNPYILTFLIEIWKTFQLRLKESASLTDILFFLYFYFLIIFIYLKKFFM